MDKQTLDENLNELCRLAAAFRRAGATARPAAARAYAGLLDEMLDTGWRGVLDPESELPDEFMPARYLQPTRRPVPRSFLGLRRVLREYDVLVLDVAQSGLQHYRGTVVASLSCHASGIRRRAPDRIEFDGASGSWGNPVLAEGQRALVFLAPPDGRGRLSQRPWHGHLDIVEHGGDAHVVLFPVVRAASEVPGRVRPAVVELSRGGRPVAAAALTFIEQEIAGHLAWLASPASIRQPIRRVAGTAPGSFVLDIDGGPDPWPVLEEFLVDCASTLTQEGSESRREVSYAGGAFRIETCAGRRRIVPIVNAGLVLTNVVDVLCETDAFVVLPDSCRDAATSGPSGLLR